MGNQYFAKASLIFVVLYGQNDNVYTLTIHQLHRPVQKSTWTSERPLAWSPSHPYLCGDNTSVTQIGTKIYLDF